MYKAYSADTSKAFYLRRAVDGNSIRLIYRPRNDAKRVSCCVVYRRRLRFAAGGVPQGSTLGPVLFFFLYIALSLPALAVL